MLAPDCRIAGAHAAAYRIPTDGPDAAGHCGGVNPSLTIQAIACRTADRIHELARRGEL